MDIANTTQSNNNAANVSSSISGNVNSAEEMSTMFLEWHRSVIRTRYNLWTEPNMLAN